MRKANNEIITKVQELMELRRMSEELQAEIDALQETVKDFMGSEETMIAGVFKVSYYRQSQRHRLYAGLQLSGR